MLTVRVRQKLRTQANFSRISKGHTFTLPKLFSFAMKESSVAECKQLIAKGHQYLDVRTPEEYAAGHAEGTKNIPVSLNVNGTMTPNANFIPLVLKAFPNKSVPLVVGCKSGRRSAAAIGKMEGEGYTILVNMKGGYDAWCA
jgi:rhodanese-related sulfurtransferase